MDSCPVVQRTAKASHEHAFDVGRILGAICVAATLLPGERLVTDGLPDHAATGALLRLLTRIADLESEVEQLRFEASNAEPVQAPEPEIGDWPAKARITLDLVNAAEDEAGRLRVLASTLRWAAAQRREPGQGWEQRSVELRSKLRLPPDAPMVQVIATIDNLQKLAEGKRPETPSHGVGPPWQPKVDDRVVHQLGLAHGAYGFGIVVGVPWPTWVRVRWELREHETFEHVSNMVRLAPVVEEAKP